MRTTAYLGWPPDEPGTAEAAMDTLIASGNAKTYFTTEESIEIERRARAALMDIGVDVAVSFHWDAFFWTPRRDATEQAVRQACSVAWLSMQPTPEERSV